MQDFLIWFLLLELTAAVALPWAFVLFRFLPDRGLTLAKPAALLLFSYALWVLSLAHIWPNTQLTVWAIFMVALAGSVWLTRRRWEELREFLRNNWPVLLTAELVFTGLFVLWAFVVSGSPSISHTEKPMDFMLLNAAHQARYFPAEDLWLSGHSISYYYFGHIIVAFLTNLSGVVSSTAYNLGVATIPALAGAVAFGLLFNLVRVAGGSSRWAVTTGVAAPALVLLTGNLTGALEFVRLRGWAGEGFWDWVAIKGLNLTAATGGVFPEDFWWWFRSTRVIDTLAADGSSLDYTITEFPAFSFVLGDLHAHVLAIPFLLLAICVALNACLSPDRLGWSWLARHPAQAAALALSGGALAFINFWDFPTFLAITVGALLLKGWHDYPGLPLQAASAALAVFVPLLSLSLVMFAPFYLGSFSGQTSGILPLQDVATRPFLLFIVLGLFILISLAFLAQRLLRLRWPEAADAPAAAIAIVLAIAPLGVWVATGFLFGLATEGAGAAFDDLGRRMVLAGPGAVVVATAGYCALTLARRADHPKPVGPEPVASDHPEPVEGQPAVSFTLLLMGLGFYLLLGAELFHIVDSFGSPWRRMNTVFKFYYQAWLLLGIVAAFALYSLWSARAESRSAPRWRILSSTAVRYAGAGGLAVLLVASFYYTAGALLDRSAASAEGRTLDGMAFLKESAPGEHAAIAWLRDEAEPGRIVEAVGDDYSDYGRISAATGRASLLGWKGHEVQWRGSHEAFAGREEDIAAIYSGTDAVSARWLLEHYGARYVYLGNRERQTYGVSALPEYADFLKTAFQQDGVIVYELWEDPSVE
ncbi:MAG: hypothetical protein F4X27_04910 [Chloroflexi bacterium]|nr:hypothetical protein [Chloroflexota bacterium]